MIPMHPPRALDFRSLVALTFFCVAGGPYGIEDAVGAAGPMLALVGLLLIPWLWSLPTALMTAELSSALPEDGGYVVWVHRAFGRFWAFQEGWWSWLYSFADIALYPVMFVDYLSYLYGPITGTERWLWGMAVIVSMTWLNIRGVQVIGRIAVLFTLLVLAPFAVMALVGAPQVTLTSWTARSEVVDWGTLLSVLLWNTCGWDNAGCCAGEVENPERTYPRAMMAAVLLVMLAYLITLAVGVGVNTQWSEWKEGYFPTVASQIGGSWLGTWLMVAGLISAVGLFSSLLCAAARIPYALATLRMFPTSLTTLHPRYRTPWIAILLQSTIVSLLIPFSFQELLEVDVFLYALALIPEFAALVWLRIKEPDLLRPYRVPGGVLGTVVLSLPPILLCLLTMTLASLHTKLIALSAVLLGIMIAGLIVYRERQRGVLSVEIS